MTSKVKGTCHSLGMIKVLTSACPLASFSRDMTGQRMHSTYTLNTNNTMHGP